MTMRSGATVMTRTSGSGGGGGAAAPLPQASHSSRTRGANTRSRRGYDMPLLSRWTSRGTQPLEPLIHARVEEPVGRARCEPPHTEVNVQEGLIRQRGKDEP